MALNRQPDLFLPDPQPELLESEPAPVYRGDPDRVRRRLEKILAETRAAQRLPGDSLRLYRTIVPQMVLWLPEEEAAQYRLQFDAEVKRLEAA